MSEMDLVVYGDRLYRVNPATGYVAALRIRARAAHWVRLNQEGPLRTRLLKLAKETT